MKKSLIAASCAMAALCGTTFAQNPAFTEAPAVKSHNNNPWGLVYADALTENVDTVVGKLTDFFGKKL